MREEILMGDDASELEMDGCIWNSVKKKILEKYGMILWRRSCI